MNNEQAHLQNNSWVNTSMLKLLQEQYESFIKVNNSKNLFKSMRTPAVLVTFMIIDYVLQEFLQLIGLDTIASIFSAALCFG